VFLIWIPLLPLLGFLINSLAGRRLPREVSGGIASAAMLGSFGLAIAALRELLTQPAEIGAISFTAYNWIRSSDFVVPVTLRIDALSALMILVVTGIGFLIHIYSTAYMHEETPAEYARYFSYLNLFVAFMLILVLASNFLLMFVGWEGVGLCSYLLIGFWYQKPSAVDAGKKAFIVNRIGDVAFILGVLLTFVRFGTLEFQSVATSLGGIAPETHFGTLSLISLLLFVGATGKSAQIPLYVWLPDAMEGPTPVSALIHAATMVTAGVYLIGRNAVLFSHAPMVLTIVAVTGAATAIWAGAFGLVQNDIKRVLAYSTVSQLGYMVLAMGVGAFGAGIFHLFTHAFFKALLFLGAGAVIHALGGEQDLRHMGGLRRELPITYWTFLIAALAIAGVPGLAGFFSKDEILARTFLSGHLWLWVIGTLTSFLTALYMFRLVFMTFYGERRSVNHDHVHDAGHDGHDAPPAMAVPLIVLAIGSILAGYAGVPAILGGANRFEKFLAPSFETTGLTDVAQTGTIAENGRVEVTLMVLASLIALAGIAVAARIYLKRPETAGFLAARFPGVYSFLLHKGYVDEIYDEAIVEPIKALSEGPLWKGLDSAVIDGAVNGTGTIVAETGGIIGTFQTGSMRTYAVSLLLGVVLVAGYYLWR